MLKSLLQLAVLLVIGIVLYNYFLGTPEERKQSEAIFREVGELGKSVFELVKAEKEKFDAGKYDEALKKIGLVFKDMKAAANDDDQMLSELEQLEARRQQLMQRLAKLEAEAASEYDEFRAKGVDSTQEEAIKQELQRLMRQTERLMRELQAKESQQGNF